LPTLGRFDPLHQPTIEFLAARCLLRGSCSTSACLDRRAAPLVRALSSLSKGDGATNCCTASRTAQRARHPSAASRVSVDLLKTLPITSILALVAGKLLGEPTRRRLPLLSRLPSSLFERIAYTLLDYIPLHLHRPGLKVPDSSRIDRDQEALLMEDLGHLS
jgi:hypothetical protein